MITKQRDITARYKFQGSVGSCPCAFFIRTDFLIFLGVRAQVARALPKGKAGFFKRPAMHRLDFAAWFPARLQPMYSNLLPDIRIFCRWHRDTEFRCLISYNWRRRSASAKTRSSGFDCPRMMPTGTDYTDQDTCYIVRHNPRHIGRAQSIHQRTIRSSARWPCLCPAFRHDIAAESMGSCGRSDLSQKR